MKMKLKSVKVYDKDKYGDGTKKVVKSKSDDGEKKYNDKLVGRTSTASTNVKPTGDQVKKEEVQKAAGIKGNSPLKPGQKGYNEELKSRTMKLNVYNKQTTDQRAAATSKAKSEMSADSTVKKSGTGSTDRQTTKTKDYVAKTQAREQAMRDEDKKKTTKEPAVQAYKSSNNKEVKKEVKKPKQFNTSFNNEGGKVKLDFKKMKAVKMENGTKKIMKLKMGGKLC